MASREAEDIAVAVDKVLSAQRVGVVRDWLLGGFPGGYAIKVQIRDGRTFEARGATIGAAVDGLVVKLSEIV